MISGALSFAGDVPTGKELENNLRWCRSHVNRQRSGPAQHNRRKRLTLNVLEAQMQDLQDSLGRVPAVGKDVAPETLVSSLVIGPLVNNVAATTTQKRTTAANQMMKAFSLGTSNFLSSNDLVHSNGRKQIPSVAIVVFERADISTCLRQLVQVVLTTIGIVNPNEMKVGNLYLRVLHREVHHLILPDEPDILMDTDITNRQRRFPTSSVLLIELPDISFSHIARQDLPVFVCLEIESNQSYLSLTHNESNYTVNQIGFLTLDATITDVCSPPSLLTHHVQESFNAEFEVIPTSNQWMFLPSVICDMNAYNQFKNFEEMRACIEIVGKLFLLRANEQEVTAITGNTTMTILVCLDVAYAEVEDSESPLPWYALAQ